MKVKFKDVFNNFEDDLINIDEQSIYDDIDIDISKVKERAFEQLNTNINNNNSVNTNGKKRYNKKFRITLIAAVISVSIILGTTAAYASGMLDSIFGGFFGGNLNAAGLYDGKNVTFESPDPNINAQLLGITGDERQVYAMIEVSHKDDTPITDEGFIHPFWGYDESEYEDEVNYKYVGDEEYNKRYNCNPYFVDENGDYLCQVPPCLEVSDDAKTMKILLKMPIGGRDISNWTLVVENQSIGAYNDSESKFFDFPFTMSFKIDVVDNDYIDKELTINDAPSLVLSEADEVNMEITPYAINITAKADMQVYKKKGASIEYKYTDFICFNSVDFNNSKVILNDGTEYFMYYYPSGGNNIVDGEPKDEYYEEVMVLNFSKVFAPLDAEVNIIDTREIKAVVINGDTVYGQE